MITDVNGYIDPEEMPLCPLCDQPIMTYEPTGEIHCAGTKALAHEACIEEIS